MLPSFIGQRLSDESGIKFPGPRNNLVLKVCGDDRHGHLGMVLPNARYQLQAVGSGHVEIDQRDVDCAGCDRAERIVGAGGFDQLPFRPDSPEALAITMRASLLSSTIRTLYCMSRLLSGMRSF